MEIIIEMARAEHVYFSIDEMLKVFKTNIMEVIENDNN